jgi:hypothetical protein
MTIVSIDFLLDEALIKSVKGFAKNEDFSLTTVILAAFKVF